jgi:outer membrane protein assembly complex protein YaeT
MRTGAALLAGLALVTAALGCRAVREAADELPFELELAFEGNASFDAGRLGEIVRRELVRLEVDVPDKAAVDDAAFALESFYRSRGHAEVLVDYDFRPATESAPARARFLVSEGPVVRVRALTVEGTSAMDNERVRTYFGTAARGGIYDEAEIAAGIGRVRDKYREFGYLRIAFEEPEVERDPASASVAIRIVLHEGPEFRVREILVQGGVPELTRREGQLAFQHSGTLYQPVLLPRLENALIEAYRRSGYPDVEVDAQPTIDEETGEVRIALQITPGERVRVAHFRIDGNTRTKDAAILDVIGIEPGAAYDVEAVRKAFRELYATGLFESVELELEGAGPERTLRVEVVEGRSVEIRLEGGWGSYEGPRALVGIQEKNFQGRGQVVELEGTLSVRAQGLRLSWIDRDFLGTSFTSETSAFVEKREEPSFEYVRRGLGFFLRRDLAHDWSTSFGYEYRPTSVTDDDVVSPLDDDTNVGALSAVFTLDDRDNLLLPTRGRLGRARVELADDVIGSDTEFLRGQLEYAHLLRLGEHAVLAASARTGVIAPFGETDEIPVTERYFNGGENTVRSFEEDELLPPGASGEPQGGEAATTLNLELRRALTGNLTAAAFFDWGNVTAEVQDYLDFDGFRPGLGLGVRYLLPIGPVRLDLGYNPTADDDEDDFVLHFSVGFPF